FRQGTSRDRTVLDREEESVESRRAPLRHRDATGYEDEEAIALRVRPAVSGSVARRHRVDHADDRPEAGARQSFQQRRQSRTGGRVTSAFPGTPLVLRAGLVLADPATLVVQRVIALQYNPDSLSRSLQVRGVTGEGGDRLDALRLTGPPVETIKLDAE